MSPRHIDRTDEGCLAAREVLNRVGDKWSVLIVAMLGDGPRRFTELKRNIEGISQRMLTLTVRGLARDGLVSRTVFPTIPPRVDYALTAAGERLRERVAARGAGANDNRLTIQEARAKFDAKEARRVAKNARETSVSGRTVIKR